MKGFPLPIPPPPRGEGERERLRRFLGNRFAAAGSRASVTLDDEVFVYLQARADEKGRTLSDLVNDLLRREIDLVEAVK